MNTRKKALIILAEGFEETEAVGVIDILRRGKIEVTVAGLESLTVKASRQVLVQADCMLADVQGSYDALILPGGSKGSEKLAASQKVREWIQKMHADHKIIGAICAAPAVVLSPLGILDHKKATCYPGMEKYFSSSTQYLSQPVITDSSVITSQGLGTTLSFGLTLLETLTDQATALQVKKDILA